MSLQAENFESVLVFLYNSIIFKEHGHTIVNVSRSLFQFFLDKFDPFNKQADLVS
jgi:hypothetical protein